MVKGEKMERYLTLDLNNKRDATFFAEKLFADRDEWRRMRRKKEAELNSIRTLSSVSQSEVHSGNIANPTENKAMDVLRLEDDIKRYENYAYVVEYGLSNIEPDEREILEAFYFTKGKMLNALVDELANKYCCDPRTIYRRKRTAILNFVDAVKVIINY